MTYSTMISLIVCYLLGALPVGWIIVWLTKKRDIRYYASGRMGTSNVIRMVGIAAGLVTLALDFTKGYLAVQIVRAINPNAGTWVEAIGGFLAVLGHVFSIFLIEKRRNGKYYLRGGAGGATSLGVAVGIWPLIIFWIGIPAILIYLAIGYASIATLSINLLAIIIFSVKEIFSIEPHSPWYIMYAVLTLMLVTYTLRPNLRRLMRGEERVMKFSLHARLKQKKEQQ